MKKVAILTDTVSPDFYFPKWHSYYSDAFGACNIFLITTYDQEQNFNEYDLGGVICVEYFNNTNRLKVIEQTANRLLNNYDIIIRVDVDEFLVPDPSRYAGIYDYTQQLTIPYVTCVGLNVVPDFDDKPLCLDRNIFLGQRKLVNPYDALFKTAITTKPLRWAPGFHFCSVPPVFHHLYLFHFKLADTAIQVRIGEAVALKSDESLFQDYHRTQSKVLEDRLNVLRAYQRECGIGALNRKSYVERFLSEVKFTSAWGGIYHGGPMQPEQVLVELSDNFCDVL